MEQGGAPASCLHPPKKKNIIKDSHFMGSIITNVLPNLQTLRLDRLKRLLSPLSSLPWGGLTPLTDEPGVGGQAGLVVVLVGAGARGGRAHSAVFGVIGQPGPGAQAEKREVTRDASCTCTRSRALLGPS